MPARARALRGLLIAVEGVVIVKKYREETRQDGLVIIHNQDRAVCPDCGGLLTGYDRRRRSVRDDIGSITVYLLRRLYCHHCNRLHLELPGSLTPHRHYPAPIIIGTVSGTIDHCPADDSTIRRWKSGQGKNYPPVLPVRFASEPVCYSCTGAEEDLP